MTFDLPGVTLNTAEETLKKEERNRFYKEGVQLRNATMKERLLDVLYTVVSCAITALSITMFTLPNNIAPGGTAGLSTIFVAVTPIGMSAWNLIINAPLMLVAFHQLGFKRLTKTIMGILLLSVFLELFGKYLPVYKDDVLIAALFGGVLLGLGSGVLFLRGGSTGGVDLLGILLLRALPNVPLGTITMSCNMIIVAAAALVFHNLNVAIYSCITLFIAGRVVDMITQGVDFAKVIYIITTKGDEVSAALITEEGRGVTQIQATGGYTKEQKQVLMTVVKKNRVAQLLRLVREVDPSSFTYVVNSTEVRGNGFKHLEMNPGKPAKKLSENAESTENTEIQ